MFDAESVEITVAANLIEQNLLLGVQKIQRLNPRQRLGHERFSEIEAFVAADNVFNSPVRLYRRSQSFLIVVISCKHSLSSQSVSAKHRGHRRVTTRILRCNLRADHARASEEIDSTSCQHD